MKSYLLAGAFVALASAANACQVQSAFQSCPDGTLGQVGGGFASPFPTQQSGNAIGTIGGQPFQSFTQGNSTMGTIGGRPFIINRF